MSRVQENLARRLDPTPLESSGLEEYLCSHIVPDKVPEYSFRKHMALREPLLNASRQVATLKGSQIGFSTGLVGMAVHHCDEFSHDVQYFLPTDDMTERFCANKVDRIITRSPRLSRIVRERQRINTKAKDTMAVKSIGQGLFYLKGLDTPRSTLMDPADLVIFDEVDDLNETHMKQAHDRIAHSPNGMIRYAGVGRNPGYGIDRIYSEKSDQREFVYDCHACGYSDQVLQELFPDNMYQRDDGSWYIGCIKCEAEMDRDSGRWIAQKPERPMPGYRISQLCVPAVSSDYIMELYFDAEGDTVATALFNSQVLAKPDAGMGQPITDEVLRKITCDYLMQPSSSMSFIGIDVGNLCHLSVSEPDPITWRPRFIHFESVPQTALIERVVELDTRLRFGVAVIDRKPSLTTATGLADALGRKRVYLQEWKGSVFTMDKPYEPIAGSQDLFCEVTMDRDIWLDNFKDMLVRSETILPAKGDGEHGKTMGEVHKHLKMLSKVMAVSPKGVTYASYRRNVDNHYAIASSFANAAQMIYRNLFAAYTGAGILSGTLPQ